MKTRLSLKYFVNDCRLFNKRDFFPFYMNPQLIWIAIHRLKYFMSPWFKNFTYCHDNNRPNLYGNMYQPSVDTHEKTRYGMCSNHFSISGKYL